MQQQRQLAAFAGLEDLKLEAMGRDDAAACAQ